jgi:hypothetical protein
MDKSYMFVNFDNFLSIGSLKLEYSWIKRERIKPNQFVKERYLI